jgi:hypothetical protein
MTISRYVIDYWSLFCQSRKITLKAKDWELSPITIWAVSFYEKLKNVDPLEKLTPYQGYSVCDRLEWQKSARVTEER